MRLRVTNCEEGAVLLLLLRLVAATHAEAAKRSAHLNGHRYLDIKTGSCSGFPVEVTVRLRQWVPPQCHPLREIRPYLRMIKNHSPSKRPD